MDIFSHNSIKYLTHIVLNERNLKNTKHQCRSISITALVMQFIESIYQNIGNTPSLSYVPLQKCTGNCQWGNLHVEKTQRNISSFFYWKCQIQEISSLILSQSPLLVTIWLTLIPKYISLGRYVALLWALPIPQTSLTIKLLFHQVRLTHVVISSFQIGGEM